MCPHPCPSQPGPKGRAAGVHAPTGVVRVREALGPDVRHRASCSMNNRIEQDHRGITQRYYPLRGFGFFAAPALASVRRMTSSAIISVPALASPNPSPSPNNAAGSRNAGARYARCSRPSSPPRRLSPPVHCRLPHVCVLKPDASEVSRRLHQGESLSRTSGRPRGHIHYTRTYVA